MTLSSILLPALFAGAVAVGVTVAVERLGGLVGGVLGTLPTTIVPAALGIYGTATQPAFELAMYAVAPGMFLNALFLLVFGALPSRLPLKSSGARLTVTVGVGLGLWAVGALLLTSLLRPRLTFAFALTATVALAVVGLVTTARTVQTPRARKRVGVGVLLARGMAAALAIAAAVIIAARGGDIAAGIVSVFPAIFLTTMVALWLAHGESVSGGAVGPMMVGSTAVAAYALFVTVSFRALGPLGGAVVAWLVIAVALQLPLYLLARGLVGRLSPSRKRSAV